MKSAHIVGRSDVYRAEAERFVRDIYAREYGAQITQFADQLICRSGPNGEILCVAGLRLAEDGFFLRAVSNRAD